MGLVTWRELFNVSVPQLVHLSNIGTYLTELL